MISFAVEGVDQSLVEGEAMLRDQWEEIAAYKDKVPLDPDYDRYRKMEAAGQLLICTARDDGKLVGYSAYFVHRGIHYSQNIVATNDVFYISPEYRIRRAHGRMLIAAALLDYAEEKLKALGVSVISIHIKLWKDWSPLAERQGYARVEFIHQKYVGA